MKYRRILKPLILTVVIIIAIVLFVVQRQVPRQILSSEEAQLQVQVQKIFNKGTDSDCNVISNKLYESLCHDYFIAKNTPLPTAPVVVQEITINIPAASSSTFTEKREVDAFLKTLPQWVQDEILSH